MTRPRLTFVLLALLAVAGLLLQHGSVPHLHDGREPGVYNQEHDLTLFASLAAQAHVPDAAPVLSIDAVSAAIAPIVPPQLPVRHAQSGHTRAPPAA